MPKYPQLRIQRYSRETRKMTLLGQTRVAARLFKFAILLLGISYKVTGKY